MISSVIVKQLTSVKFVKVEINTVTGKMVLKRAEYNLTPEEIQLEIGLKHRLSLPCKIVDDVAVFYVPVEWDGECIENYTQALMDELYLHNKRLSGYKSIEEIENSFVLEVILL